MKRLLTHAIFLAVLVIIELFDDVCFILLTCCAVSLLCCLLALGHHCGIWAHPTGWCHGQSSSVFFQDNDDFYPDEPLFYREPPSDSSKAKSYSDRYQFSCEQSSSEDYCHLNAWKTSLKEKCAKTDGAGSFLILIASEEFVELIIVKFQYNFGISKFSF